MSKKLIFLFLVLLIAVIGCAEKKKRMSDEEYIFSAGFVGVAAEAYEMSDSLSPLPAKGKKKDQEPGGVLFTKVFGNVSTITMSHGGLISDFTDAAEEVLRTGRKIKIDGRCASACAIFADMARPNICITRRARFGFHMVHDLKHSNILLGPMPMSKDINSWVMSHGGYPNNQMLMMYFKEAKAFWPVCK